MQLHDANHLKHQIAVCILIVIISALFKIDVTLSIFYKLYINVYKNPHT